MTYKVYNLQLSLFFELNYRLVITMMMRFQVCTFQLLLVSIANSGRIDSLGIKLGPEIHKSIAVTKESENMKNIHHL